MEPTAPSQEGLRPLELDLRTATAANELQCVPNTSPGDPKTRVWIRQLWGGARVSTILANPNDADAGDMSEDCSQPLTARVRPKA